MSIKFVDLAAQNAEISDEVSERLAEVHATTAYVGGPQVGAFERAFAEFLGVRQVIGVSSGTDAIRLALLGLGIGHGDTVITTPMTFIATAAAIFQTGARVVFVDVDPTTGNLCPHAAEQYVRKYARAATGRPRAIVPVDLYGLPARLDEFHQLAQLHGLKLVEDACQAHGARFLANGNWHMAGGALADAACFSFYPGKNLGAWGEGGAIAINDDATAATLMQLRDHGRTSHYSHDLLGYNARLDTLQAVVLSTKLKRLAGWNQRRRAIAALYSELLHGTPLELPREPDDRESVYHLYVIRTERRDEVRQALTAAGIACGVHYPVPLHLQPACRGLGYRAGDFPFAERWAATVLSLPMHPHLRDEEVIHVAEVVRATLARG